METVVRDVRYVYDLFELPFLVQGRVEHLDERLDDHREIVFFIVPTAVDLMYGKNRKLKKQKSIFETKKIIKRRGLHFSFNDLRHGVL